MPAADFSCPVLGHPEPHAQSGRILRYRFEPTDFRRRDLNQIGPINDRKTAQKLATARYLGSGGTERTYIQAVSR